MKKKQIQAITEIKSLLKDARRMLQINREQSNQAIIFDMLMAIDNASELLNDAWKITQENHLDDTDFRQEFVEMFSYFGKIKREILRDTKHKH